jgi:hypothetical protein
LPYVATSHYYSCYIPPGHVDIYIYVAIHALVMLIIIVLLLLRAAAAAMLLGSLIASG